MQYLLWLPPFFFSLTWKAVINFSNLNIHTNFIFSERQQGWAPIRNAAYTKRPYSVWTHILRVNYGLAMHTNIQIVRFHTYMSSSLLPFRPFFVFPIMNIYIHKQRWCNYINITTVSEQNKSLAIPRTLHMALIICQIRYTFHVWSWHGMHSSYHEKFHGMWRWSRYSMVNIAQGSDPL